jgi:hypothetical protein
MSTGHQTQPAGEGPESGGPRPDTGGEPPERGTRGLVVGVGLLLLLALGMRTVIAVNRTRSRVRDGSVAPPERSARPAQALPSVMLIAAAPRSVVYVVSAARLGRSHLEMAAAPVSGTPSTGHRHYRRTRTA